MHMQKLEPAKSVLVGGVYVVSSLTILHLDNQ